jgi:hypothetical protein
MKISWPQYASENTRKHYGDSDLRKPIKLLIAWLLSLRKLTSSIGRLRKCLGINREFLADLLLLFGKRCRRDFRMAGLFYTVDFCANEEMARADPSLVERYLVELVCEEHSNTDGPQVACKIVLQSFNAKMVAITKYRVAERVSPEIVPTNRSNPFLAPCGCRFWSLPKLRS